MGRVPFQASTSVLMCDVTPYIARAARRQVARPDRWLYRRRLCEDPDASGVQTPVES